MSPWPSYESRFVEVPTASVPVVHVRFLAGPVLTAEVITASGEVKLLVDADVAFDELRRSWDRSQSQAPPAPPPSISPRRCRGTTPTACKGTPLPGRNVCCWCWLGGER